MGEPTNSNENYGHLSMGAETYKVPLELFELNRTRLAEKLAAKVEKKALVLLQGGDDIPFNDTDVLYNNFRQESYFMWAFGVVEPGFFGAIDVDTKTSYLFMPRLPQSYSIWMGKIHGNDHFAKKYKVSKVHYVDELEQVLKKLGPSVLLTLKGTNSDSGLESHEAVFEGIQNFTVNNKVLYPIISDLRVYKTKYEYEVMKYVIEVSSAAHKVVMRKVRPGISEYSCESEFLHYCYGTGGCRHASYTCICGTGTNSSVLHYGHAGAPNDTHLQKGEICLFDMGANYYGYAADITCSFPVTGKFTEDQKLIYEAVLAANLAVFNKIKPGTSWVDMHILAVTVILEHLKRIGILEGNVEEMVKAGVGYIFQPHGLGHLLGLDVHDVGGYLEGHPERPKYFPGLEKLRTARILEEGMFLTIEPGCYFIETQLNKAKEDPKLSKYFKFDVIDARFRNFGGVRIEDDVYVGKDKAVNLTKVPRTVEEIEKWMAGKDY